MSTLKNRMILATIAVFVVCMPFAASAQLVITGVFDGPLSGGLPKCVEMVALEDIADLSTYAIGSANNGGGTDGEEFLFPADAATAGQFIYVSSEAPGFLAFFGFDADYNSGAANINGDDAVELFNNGVVIDVFGDINMDGTGQPWEHLDGWAYRVNNTVANAGTFVVETFSYSGPNALDGETDNATAAVPFPIGTYTFDGVANETSSWGSVKAMFN